VRKIDAKGYDFIKQCEGLRLKSYQDTKGVWTIGYGNTKYSDDTPVKKGESITLEQAEALLKYKFDKFAKRVDAVVKSDITTNQFSALTSLAYNIGSAGFDSSTVLKKVNTDHCDYDGISAAFRAWNKITVNGVKVVDKGLVNRREKEINLYFKD